MISLYLVRLRMERPSGEWLPEGGYVATRVVEAADPDGACASALERERARQTGTGEAGGLSHEVLGVAGLRRLPSREVRP